MDSSKPPFKSRPTGNRWRRSAGAYEELASLMQKAGDQAAVLAVHRKALAVRRAAFEPEAGASARLDLARSLLATGWLERASGDLAAAGACGEEAARPGQRDRTHPANADAVSEVLTTAYRLIAVVLLETGDHEGALTAYRDLVAIRQKLADGQSGASLARSSWRIVSSSSDWLCSSARGPARRSPVSIARRRPGSGSPTPILRSPITGTAWRTVN